MRVESAVRLGFPVFVPARLLGAWFQAGLLDQIAPSWVAGGMTHSARKLIEEFDALPEEERSEVLAELARRVGLSPHDLPRDEDLLAAADQLCVELDRRESSDSCSS